MAKKPYRLSSDSRITPVSGVSGVVVVRLASSTNSSNAAARSASVGDTSPRICPMATSVTFASHIAAPSRPPSSMRCLLYHDCDVPLVVAPARAAHSAVMRPLPIAASSAA